MIECLMGETYKSNLRAQSAVAGRYEPRAHRVLVLPTHHEIGNLRLLIEAKTDKWQQTRSSKFPQDAYFAIQPASVGHNG